MPSGGGSAGRSSIGPVGGNAASENGAGAALGAFDVAVFGTGALDAHASATHPSATQRSFTARESTASARSSQRRLTSQSHFDISKLVEIFAALGSLSALAHETRLRVFRALVARGPEGLPAGRIAQRLELPGPTLSFHLAQLKGAGLVACRRDGRSLIYSADFEAMRALVDYLTENCCREGAVRCLPAARSARAKARRA